MAPALTYREYGEGIGAAASVLRANAVSAGLAAPVPTCPGWDVLDLVVHQGMVHRWATAVLLGQTDPRRDRWDDAAVSAQGRAHRDVLDWFDDGLVELLNALARAPEDLDVFFFLRNAASPRLGWARRQCHETTIHAVDAMAARLGRAPTANEVWVSARHASDGVRELLTGFVPRGKSPLRDERPRLLVVRCSDTDESWTVAVSDGPPQVQAGEPERGGGDATVTGTARQLYLGLWNRGDELRLTGDPQLLALWRARMTVSW